MDIIFILQLLYRRIWILVLIPLLAASLTFFTVYRSTKLYKSSAQLATGFTTNEEITVTEERFNLRDVGTKFSNLIEKMSSPQVMSLVSYNVILHDLKSEKPFRFGRDKDDNIIPLSAEQRTEAIQLFQKKLDNFELISSYDPKEKELTKILKTRGYYYTNFEKAVQIKRVNFTDFLSIEYTSENPELSALVVNSLVNEIIRYEKSLRSDRSTESVEFFSNLMEKKKAELDKVTHKLDSFKLSNNVVDYKMESENKLSQITYYELKRDEETKNIQALQLSIANIDNKLSQAGDPNSNSGNTKNEKILELRKKINELNQIYIDGGSKDAKLKSTIENLQERLQIEMTAPVVNGSAMSADEISRLKAEREDNRLKLKIAESNLQSVNNTLWGLKGNMSGYANKESSLANLQLEVQRASDEYADALDKFNVEKSKSLISNIAIKPILSAQPAGEPESNKTMLKTALAFIVSLIICVVGVVMVEFFDLSIKTQTQFHRMTKLDLSGVLNNIKHTTNLNLSQVFSAEDTKPEHKTFKHLIRKIRYEIEKENPQVILVTSTQEKVGKSFLIVSLSYSLSLINKKVLIVDTNFKNNTLSKLLLAKQNDQKLLKRAETMKSIGPHGDHVEEETAEDVNFNSIISKTAHRNVFVIGSKKSSDSPSEILSGRHFEELLVDLRKNYDYIFLEGAALNDYSDTKELVLYADKVLPVFSAETVIKEADKESIRFLRSLNGKIMGSVLNKVNEKDMKL